MEIQVPAKWRAILETDPWGRELIQQLENETDEFKQLAIGFSMWRLVEILQEGE